MSIEITKGMKLSVEDLEGISGGASSGSDMIVIVNCRHRVPVRAGASVNSPEVAKAYAWHKYELLGREGSWYKINVNGVYGYVYYTHVQKDPD